MLSISIAGIGHSRGRGASANLAAKTLALDVQRPICSVPLADKWTHGVHLLHNLTFGVPLVLDNSTAGVPLLDNCPSGGVPLLDNCTSGVPQVESLAYRANVGCAWLVILAGCLGSALPFAQACRQGDTGSRGEEPVLGKVLMSRPGAGRF